MKLIDADAMICEYRQIAEDKEKRTTGERRRAKRLVKALAQAKRVDLSQLIISAAVPFDYKGAKGIRALMYGHKIILCLDDEQLKKIIGRSLYE